MPKVQGKKRNGAAQSSPYGSAIFKMKTNIGQHVLKNPGVVCALDISPFVYSYLRISRSKMMQAQAIVDKADLKQSDVREQQHNKWADC